MAGSTPLALSDGKKAAKAVTNRSAMMTAAKLRVAKTRRVELHRLREVGNYRWMKGNLNG
jgi:chromosome condensin MukBEF MukE localization factor